MRKSRFFSLLCAFCPGAGEMYLGLMKRGTALMIAFWGIIAFVSVFFVDFLLFLLPVIWFYSFFDTLTLRNLDYQELRELQEEDAYWLMGRDYRTDAKNILTKHRLLVGSGCIFLGLAMLYNRLLNWLRWNDLMPDWLRSLLSSLPSFLMAFVIIGLGLWLVRGKKMPADRVEDYPQYHGSESHQQQEQ